jgi:site-specific DNA-methyltransferase (adenine-specific)
VGDKGDWPITKRRHNDATWTVQPVSTDHATGRWPANLCHDGSPEVLEAFARFGVLQSGTGAVKRASSADRNGNQGATYGAESRPDGTPMICHGDTGTAARFFFCGKAQSWEREGNHPTVKPTALMEWLVSLVTPPGGPVLDPFCGTGSTLVACDWLGIPATGIELDPKTCADAERKVKRLRARRMRGEVERHEPLPGQLALF